MKASLTIIFLALILTASAQTDKNVYYYIDALNSYPESPESDLSKIYLYSFPIYKTTPDKVDNDAILKSFKNRVKSLHKIEKFASCVVRVNDNYDELMALRERSISKYKNMNYQILKVEEKE